MRLIDYLLLAIVAVCAVIAWRVWRRAMKKGGCCGSGCTGNCAQCGRNCDCNCLLYTSPSPRDCS